MNHEYDVLCQYHALLKPHVVEFIEENMECECCNYEWHKMARHMLDGLNTLECLLARMERHPMDDENYEDVVEGGIDDSPLTQKEAHEWVSKMQATGGIPWKPWTVEETKEMLTTNNKKLGNLSDWCANALLNMLWSDNPVAKKETILSDAAKYVADPDVIPAANRLGLTYRYFSIH